MTQLADAVDSFADALLENIQYILTVHHDARPADQHIHNWLTEPAAEIFKMISPSTLASTPTTSSISLSTRHVLIDSPSTTN